MPITTEKSKGTHASHENIYIFINLIKFRQMSETNGGVQTLTVSGILNDLDQGVTRAGIQAKYNLSGKDLAQLFSHPKLKGKKTKVAPSFTLVDDTVDVVVDATPMTEALDTNETENEATPVTISEEF